MSPRYRLSLPALNLSSDASVPSWPVPSRVPSQTNRRRNRGSTGDVSVPTVKPWVFSLDSSSIAGLLPGSEPAYNPFLWPFLQVFKGGQKGVGPSVR